MTKAIELANALENLEATGWGGDCFALTEHSEKQAELAAAELRRLAAVEQAFNEWHTKTEWVQDTCKPKELGRHRADVLRERIEAVEQELAELKAAMGEPVAWDVYVECADNGYLVDSLDDPQLIDDCTNHNAVVTPLYAIKAAK